MTLTGLIPMLPVRNMPASVDFYCGALGFEVEVRRDDWGWAMLRSGECRLMVDESINAAPLAPRTSVLYLYPEDVAECHARLKSAGYDAPDVDGTFYGHNEFRVEDPDGNRLWIGRPASE